MAEPKGGSQLNLPLTVVIFATLITLFCQPLGAQTHSINDTLGTVAVEGERGDTVTVLFDLKNTFLVGGFQFRVTYDSTCFVPLSIGLAARSESLDVFGSYFGDAGIATFYATRLLPLDHPIPIGSGPIAAFELAILENAAPGIYYLGFEDSDSNSHENALSNAMGDSLIIPIFVEGPISILPLGVHYEEPELSREFALAQNYPNPFNIETKISFVLNAPSQVELSVIDLLGRVVATPFSGNAPAGESSVIWDGKTSGGKDVTSGIYFYRLINSGGKSVTQKMTLLK